MKLKLLAALTLVLGLGTQTASAQTTMTMSSWVPPSHGLTKEFLPGWAAMVEKARRIVEDLGGQIADPRQARELFALPTRLA